MNRHLLTLAVSLLLGAGCSEWGADSRSAAQRCDGLYRLTDLTRAVSPGVMVAAQGDQPAHCRVRGVIDRSIRFEVSMPIDGWQGRLMFHAVGGNAGVLGDTTSFLGQGFAGATTDTGHGGGPQSSAFARDDQAFINFSYRAIDLTARLAQRILHGFYGQEAAHSYLWGCSGGGRVALTLALRYPELFDGIIAGAPAAGWGAEIISFGVAAARKQAAGPLTLASLDLLAANSRKRCDLLDGLADGIIGAPRACTLEALNLQALQCQAGPAADCLTAGQIATATYLYEGLKDDTGKLLIPGIFPGAESEGDWMLWVTGNPDFMPVPGFQGLETMTEDLWHRKPGFTAAQFDPIKDWQALRETTNPLDVPAPDFTEFRKAGGKLLIYQGWNDVPCRAQVLLNLLAEAEALSGGPEKMADFHRLYMVPGGLHCIGGPGAWAADYLTPMVAWVEEGQPPERLTATHPGISNWFEAAAVALASSGETLDWYNAAMNAGAAKPNAHRFTRPLCPYPQNAQYQGGNPDAAASFACLPDLVVNREGETK